MLKKLRYSLDFWPRSEIELPRPVNASSTAKPLTVSYRAQGASTYTTFASTNYLVDTESEPGRIVLKYGVSWPSGSLEAGQSVRVDFWSGSTAVSVVPPAFLQGILLASEDWYENRGNVVVGTISSEIAMGLKSVLAELRIPAVP